MNTRRLSAVLSLALLALGLGAPPARAAIQLPVCIGSNMVLQSGRAVPIWGTAGTGDTVTVEFAKQAKTVAADATGAWRVALDPLAVSAEPAVLTVTTVSAAGATNRVVLTNVLVGDVWLGAGQSNMAMAGKSYTNGDPVLASTLQADLPNLRLLDPRTGWHPASARTSGGFSALLFSFGVPLQKELKIPVGLMTGAVGGTPSGAWLSKAAFSNDPACRAAVEKAKADPFADPLWGGYVQRMTAWSQEVAKAGQAGTNAPPEPKAVMKAGESLRPIGYLFEAHIRPLMPYAIRGVLWDQGESRTGVGAVTQDILMNALIRGWRAEWGQGDFPFLYVQKPSGGGCAWDPRDPVTRLAEPFRPLPDEPQVMNPAWECFLTMRAIPGALMVGSSDLGPYTHPVNKSGYGARAARVALGALYGRPMAISGPAFKSAAVENGKMRVAFDHTGAGLACLTNRLQGFAVAGTDKVFVWADAVIDGDTVLCGSEKVPQPVAVRYAWADSHPWANLFNRDGLPALPFRSDRW